MTKNDMLVISSAGHELSQRAFQEVLKKYHRQQEMLVSTGTRRKPDRTDRLSVPVSQNGKVQDGWWMEQVISNLNGVVGVTQVSLAFGSGGTGLRLRYIAHTGELSVLSARLPQPVYP